VVELTILNERDEGVASPNTAGVSDPGDIWNGARNRSVLQERTDVFANPRRYFDGEAGLAGYIEMLSHRVVG